MAEGQCVDKKMLAINGRDLLELGLTQGSQVGDLLELLFAKVVEDPKSNTRDTLLAEAEKYIKSGTIPHRNPKE